MAGHVPGAINLPFSQNTDEAGRFLDAEQLRERFAAAVTQLVERLGVTTVLALQAIPMPVPHTRPVTVTAHATRRALIAQYPVYWGEMRIPGSVASGTCPSLASSKTRCS